MTRERARPPKGDVPRRGGTVGPVPPDLSRRHPLVVGTVAAVLALVAAVGAAVLFQVLTGEDEPVRDVETEIRFTAEDDESDANPLVGEDRTGDPAPEERWSTFDGEQASLADYQGRAVVVNFFGSWCPPCVEEMPAFEAVHQELGDRVAFVGLAVNDSVGAARGIVEKTGVTYDVGRDASGRVFAAFGVINMPSTFLVSADGEIVSAHPGELTADELRRLVEQHLL